MTRSFSCPSTVRATPSAIVCHVNTGVEPEQDDATIRFSSDASSLVIHSATFWIFATIATDSKCNVLFGRLQAFRQRPLLTFTSSIRSFEAELMGVHGSATAARDDVDLSNFTKIQFVTDNRDVAIHLGQSHIYAVYQASGMEPLIRSTKVVLEELLGHREVEVCWVERNENTLADAFAKRPRKALERRRLKDADDVTLLIEELIVGKVYPSHMIEDLWRDLGKVLPSK